jgi:hypothetical protein
MDNKAQTSGFGAIIAVVGALVILIVYFSIIPLLGDRIDSAADITGNDYATGTLTLSGNVSDTETVTIGSVTFEFDTNLTASEITAGNVEVDIANVLPATATVNLSAAVNNNATTAALVTTTSTSTTVGVTADAAGTAGNSVTTTEACANAAFGAATLTGGTTASEWASDDITTASDLWEDNGSIIAVAMIIVIVGVILLILRGAF